MANATITVLEADGTTETDVVVLDVGRQAAAASKSTAMSTEDKAVLDSLATKLDTCITALQIIDNMVLAAGTAVIGKVGLNDGTNAITFVNNANSTSDYAVPVMVHPDSQNANGQATAANSAPVVWASDTALPAGTNAIGKLAANSGVDIGDVDVTSISAGENHLGEVGGKTAVRSVTLSTDTSAYASGDLIADTQQIDGFFRKTDGTGVINSINIIDEDAQGVALYIIFMSTSTSLGTENSTPNISDANLTAGFQGIVSVATTDYVTVSGTKVATIKNIGLPVQAVSGTDDLYIAVLNSTGTPTFTASGLEMRIGVLLD
jgi:hypothetical protein